VQDSATLISAASRTRHVCADCKYAHKRRVNEKRERWREQHLRTGPKNSFIKKSSGHEKQKGVFACAQKKERKRPTASKPRVKSNAMSSPVDLPACSTHCAAAQKNHTRTHAPRAQRSARSRTVTRTTLVALAPPHEHSHPTRGTPQPQTQPAEKDNRQERQSKGCVSPASVPISCFRLSHQTVCAASQP
jgi:hypothetical protein